MGACSIETFIRKPEMTHKELQDHFADLQQQGIYEYGHDPYNGTWSTIDRLVILPETMEVTGRPSSIDPGTEVIGFEEVNEYCLDKAEKWDHACAIKVTQNGKPLGWWIAGWAAT